MRNVRVIARVSQGPACYHKKYAALVIKGGLFQYNPQRLFILNPLFTAMTASYKELLKQREALEQQIKEAKQREMATAVAQVRELIAAYELTQEDVFPVGRAGRASSNAGVKVAPKYRDPATGQTWTGRGKPPKWIQDQDREKFAI